MIDLTRLHAQLVVSEIQLKNPALYQVINQLIRTVDEIQKLAIATHVAITPGGAISDLDIVTHSDESASLPNSRQLIAGTGITFDDTVIHQRIINASASAGGTWDVLTDGDLIEPELIFANGNVIMLHTP